MTSIGNAIGAGGAGLAAGLINAVAGGGTLVSFPVLVALGVPSVSANITNTVALCPGYLGGAAAQRHHVVENRDRLRSLLPAAAAGGLTGSVLLLISPERLFRNLVPYLILLACALLAGQSLLKKWLGASGEARQGSPVLLVAVFLCSVYGGYFGAGLGIMLLAVLGLALHDPLTRLNALKQVLSFVINILAALFFLFSGKVYWVYAAVMAVTSLVGGHLGGRLVGRMNPVVMRVVVVAFGLIAAVRFFI